MGQTVYLKFYDLQHLIFAYSVMESFGVIVGKLCFLDFKIYENSLQRLETFFSLQIHEDQKCVKILRDFTFFLNMKKPNFLKTQGGIKK